MSSTPTPKVGTKQFYDLLTEFYRRHRKVIRNDYPVILRAFLNHNDPRSGPTRPGARRGAETLRLAQFEALEMYVFLKQAGGSVPVFELFDRWYEARPNTIFEHRENLGFHTDRGPQRAIPFREDTSVADAWRELRTRMQAVAENRAAEEQAATKTKAPLTPNYIFALSMGVGKTRLMGLCILYEFLMASRYPKDERFAHNALVFAPDTTVREALREIEEMDFAAYLPASERGGLPVQIKTRVLDDDVTSLQLHDGGDFHIVISNVQKILVKQQHKKKSAAQLLMAYTPAPPTAGAFAAADALEVLEDEKDLTFNQRFNKLLRAPNLGIYIDEAHHAFGAEVAANLGEFSGKSAETAFRRTVRLLSAKLRAGGSRVVGTFCFTGTPYAAGKVLSEVVFAYSLQHAIHDRVLKRAQLLSFKNVKDEDFVKSVIDDFVVKVGPLGSAGGRRYEGMLPKLAFFAADINEAKLVLRPIVEAALKQHGLGAASVLVNTSEATADEERAFRRLDTAESEHQVIILVGKGKEGWNCRSLFGVALFRSPHSKVFVLQATMRCLRAIEAPLQHTGHIYLSDANRQILEAELMANFQLTVDGLEKAAPARGAPHPIRVNPPPAKVTLQRVRNEWSLVELCLAQPIDFDLKRVRTDWADRYGATKAVTDGAFTADGSAPVVYDITASIQRTGWSDYQLVAECARYLNRSPIEIEQVLRASAEGMDLLLARVNQYNQLVWDVLIPKLFEHFYRVDSRVTTHLEEVLLTPQHAGAVGRERGEEPRFVFQGREDLVVGPDSAAIQSIKATLADAFPRTFHVSPYVFDSGSELKTFLSLLRAKGVTEVYFTGMFTAGQTEFVLRYIEPGNTVRSYYPDFVVRDKSGGWLLLEVKADYQLKDPAVLAKAEAGRQAAAAQSGMRYALLPSSLADRDLGHLALIATAVGEDSVVRESCDQTTLK